MDPELRPFLDAATDADASSALDRLLAGPLAAVIAGAIRRELGGSFKGAQHLDDVAGDVRLRLIRKLTSLRAADRASDEGIANIAGYATITAERACYAFLRRQFPERTRFRNRVRYVLMRHPQIAFAAGTDGVWRASTREPVRAAPASGAAVAFLEDPAKWLHQAHVDQAQPLPALLPAVLMQLDRAVEFDRLVDALAAALGVAESAAAEAEDPRNEPADPAPPIGDVLEQRESLASAWREIADLPPRQRAALLLNLRDPDGGAVLQMLPATGVVSADRIAAALEISPAELTRLWPRLPLDDLSIADQLGLTRQQVINLRKSARARLARRLREHRT